MTSAAPRIARAVVVRLDRGVDHRVRRDLARDGRGADPLARPTSPAVIVVGAVLFNATAIMLSLVGGIIEWRRPGHAIGRLMMLAGPMYAIASAGWTTINLLQPLIDPMAYLVFSWTVLLLSWSGHGAHHRLDPPPLPDRRPSGPALARAGRRHRGPAGCRPVRDWRSVPERSPVRAT